MLELPHLVEKGLVEPRTSTGVALTLPVPMQTTMALEMVEYFHSNFAAAAKATLRSPQDLTYVLECMAPMLTFSPSQHFGTIMKTLDNYNHLLHSDCYVLAPNAWSPPEVQQQFFCDAIRQLSLLFAVRSDHQSCESQHVTLCSVVLNNLSSFLVRHESVLAMSTWHLIIKVLYGIENYILEKPHAPVAIRTTLASVALEAVVRSRTTDVSIWKLTGTLAPMTNFGTASQWSVVVTGFARFMCHPLVGRRHQSAITLRWHGVLDGVRKESILRVGDPKKEVTQQESAVRQQCTVADVSFMWKQLLALHNLSAIHISAFEAVMVGLRDSAVMLSKAANFQEKGDVFNYSVPQDPAAPLTLPACPSTNALVYFGGMKLLEAAARQEPVDPAAAGSEGTVESSAILAASFLNARIHAIEGVCAVFLRKETENTQTCKPAFRNAFFNVLSQLCHDESVTIRGTMLHQTTTLYLLDVELPVHLIDALTQTACGFLESVEVDRGGDDDDDDEESAFVQDMEKEDAHHEDMGVGEDGEPRMPNTATVTQMQVYRRASISHIASLLALAHRNREQLVTPLLVALLNAVENHTSDATIVQKALSIVDLNLALLRAKQKKDQEPIQERDVIHEIRSVAGALLKAPLGLHPVPVLVACINVLTGAPLSTATPVRKVEFIVQALCHFLVSLRKNEAQVEATQSADGVNPLGPHLLVKLAQLCVHRCAKFIQAHLFILEGDDESGGAPPPDNSSIISAGGAKTMKAVLTTFAKTLDELVKPLTTTGTALVREAGLCLYHTLHLAHFFPLVEHGWSGTSTATEGTWLGNHQNPPQLIKVFAVNGDHILSTILLGDGRLVTILRDQFGTRCWSWSRERLQAPDDRDGVPSPTPEKLNLMPVNVATLFASDSLAGALKDPKTPQLLKQWGSEAAVKDVIAQADSLYQTAATYTQTASFLSASLKMPLDPEDQKHQALRHWCTSLGLAATSRLRELPFDPALIAELKYLDTLNDMDKVNVDVVFLSDTKKTAAEASGGAFLQFLLSLGWRSPGKEASEAVVQADIAGQVDYTVHYRTAEEHNTLEMKAEKGISGQGSSDHIKVRLLWDETTHKVESHNTGSAQNELFASVSPQWRRSSQSRFFDIILTPLLTVGLYAVRVGRPTTFRNSCPHGLGIDDPVRWGAPLLHGCLLPSATLGKTVHSAVKDACHYRQVEAMLYRPHCTLRRQVIRKILSATNSQGEKPSSGSGDAVQPAVPIVEPVSTQSTVSLFTDGTYTATNYSQTMMVGNKSVAAPTGSGNSPPTNTLMAGGEASRLDIG